MNERILGKHIFTFGKDNNGGQQLVLTTTFIDSGGVEPEIRQELKLSAGFNSASINLYGIEITSEELVNLAEELFQTKFKLMLENSKQ